VGRIVVTEFVSLDGVIQAPGGGEEFEHAGWSFEFDRGDEGNKFKLDETMASDALLLGRVTYEGFAAAWPSRSGDYFSDRFNSMPKYVVTNTLETADWNNTTIVSGDPLERLRELKSEQNLLIWGSPTLVQSLLDAGLVDELVLLYSPIVRGKGIRLFREGQERKLRVSGATVLSGGMLGVRLSA
jgi:dihydrofolate reductase